MLVPGEFEQADSGARIGLNRLSQKTISLYQDKILQLNLDTTQPTREVLDKLNQLKDEVMLEAVNEEIIKFENNESAFVDMDRLFALRDTIKSGTTVNKREENKEIDPIDAELEQLFKKRDELIKRSSN